MVLQWEPRGTLIGPQGPPGADGADGADGGTTPHAARHAVGGDDPVSPASIGAATAGHSHDPAAPAAHAASHASGGSDPVSPAAIGAVPTARTISAGAGLTGGGDLSANRSLAVSYGTAAGTAAQGNDARLSDARTPTAHAASHASGGGDPVTPAAIGAVPTARTITAGGGLSGGGDLSANRTLAVAYGSTAGTAVQGNDARVTADQAAGTASIRTLGTGAQQAAAGNDSRLSDARTPTAHNHAAADITSGTLAIARIPTGQTGTTVPLGNDARFTDARTPTAHAASHASGGGDPITPEAIGAVPVTPAVRSGSAAASVSIDGAAAGDYDLTCTGNTAITPTGTPNGRTLVITCLASGGARTPAMAGSVKLTTGVTDRSLAIPSGGTGVFVLRYTSLGSGAGWHLASSYLVN